MVRSTTDKTTEELNKRNATAAVVVAELSDCVAVLPYWPVWAAAQFACTDECKELLNFVHVYRDGDTYQIESTDGHRAFRYRFPVVTATGTETLWRVPAGGLLLLAKPLRKATPYARLLTVSSNLRATAHGGKQATLAELTTVNLSGFFAVNHAADCATAGTYPKLNQLWPDTFTNEPKRSFAFNARYIKEWCAVVEKLSDNNVTRCSCTAATTPFCWTANVDPGIGEHFEHPMMEYLLLPVKVRD